VATEIHKYWFRIVVCFMVSTARYVAQSQEPHPPTRDYTLKLFLQEYLRTSRFGEDKTTRYFPAFVGLSNDSREQVVVYVTGQSWCGSGGCTMLILAAKGSSYKVITKIAITRPPIRLLNSKSNGWHDISVRVQGGGIHPGYDAKLSFDGRTYPLNPSTPPARRLTGNVEGEVLVPLTNEGLPVYN
jgi:hypothetical protein